MAHSYVCSKLKVKLLTGILKCQLTTSLHALGRHVAVHSRGAPTCAVKLACEHHSTTNQQTGEQHTHADSGRPMLHILLQQVTQGQRLHCGGKLAGHGNWLSFLFVSFLFLFVSFLFLFVSFLLLLFLFLSFLSLSRLSLSLLIRSLSFLYISLLSVSLIYQSLKFLLVATAALLQISGGLLWTAVE